MLRWERVAAPLCLWEKEGERRVCLVLALPKALGAAKVLLEGDGREGSGASAPFLIAGGVSPNPSGCFWV